MAFQTSEFSFVLKKRVTLISLFLIQIGIYLMPLKYLCSVICLTINNFNCFYLKIALPQQEKETFSDWTTVEKELQVSGILEYLILFAERDKHNK